MSISDDDSLCASGAGLLVINNLCLSSNPPALRGESDYLELIVAKFEKALSIAEEHDLIPVVTGKLSTKALDVGVFKRTYSLFSRSDLVIIGAGNMLDRKGFVKEKTLLDLIQSTGMSETFCPADETMINVATPSGHLRVTIGDKGDFAIMHVDGEETYSLVRSSDDLPVIGRVTQRESEGPASVLKVTTEGVTPIDVETRPPVYMDTRFDINQQDDEFNSQLAVELKALFDRDQEERPEVEVSQQLQEIIKEKDPSAEAKRIIYDLHHEVESSGLD